MICTVSEAAESVVLARSVFEYTHAVSRGVSGCVCLCNCIGGFEGQGRGWDIVMDRTKFVFSY
jgi:hypothetical protein